MSFLLKYRFWIIGVIVVVGVILLATRLFHAPVPDNTNFITSEYTFVYPRTFAAEEYAPGVVSIGHQSPNGFVPLVEVNEYKSDPQSAFPKNFGVFAKQQIEALCGSDDSLESITCAQADVAPYTSPKGFVGEKMNLTASRKNLKTGKVTTAPYGPFYVFNTTATSTDPTIPLRYSGIFVYPSFSAFLAGTTSPALLTQVITTLTLPTPKK